MDKTKIEWADSTWNPITGCRHKCPYCYARGIANRFVSRKGCHLVEPETYKLGDDGSETYEINEQPYYVVCHPVPHLHRIGQITNISIFHLIGVGNIS